MSNIKTVIFSGDSQTARGEPLWQYDYGQYLQIVGIPDLPETFEVHFANCEHGESTTQIGIKIDTNGLVTIPDMYLTSGEPVFAWIYLHTGEDDGETVYKITLSVRQRATPSDEPPTPEEQSLITQAVAALNAGVARAESAAAEIEAMHVEAETLQPGSSAYADWNDGTLLLGIPQGVQGPKGDTGDKGDKGEKGDKGNKGDKGDHGDPIDVQIGGTSILAGGIANIPIADALHLGVIKAVSTNGLVITADGELKVSAATSSDINAGRNTRNPVVPYYQHHSAFYGLAKAAGDTTQPSSGNPTGTYTPAAKAAIQSMLGVDDAIAEAVSHIVGFDFVIVQELPQTGEKGIIYLVPHQHDTDDLYDEYIWITNKFEKIGSCKVEIPVSDVQINGTSIVNNKVAEIPVANYNRIGAVLVNAEKGLNVDQITGSLAVVKASTARCKAGGMEYTPIVPYNQHLAAFYGLAKAAGHDEINSTLPAGTYTPEAKSAIKAMLDIGGETQTVQVSGATPVITANQNTRYVCGEVTSLDFTPSASGICDVIFTSGSTVTVLTLPNTVKLPAWFDATALETDTTYEISISDGIYGTVMVWQ